MRKNKKALIFMGLIVALMLCVCLAACGGGDYIEKNAKKLSAYTIEAGFDDSSKILSAVMVFDFYNNTDNSFTELKFHLYPNAYRKDASLPVVDELTRSKAYKNGFSYGDIKIDSAKSGEKAVAYVVEGTDCDILTVPPDAEVFPQQNARVEIVFEVSLANIWHRLGYGNNTINIGNWYPQLCVFKDGAWLTDPYYSNGDPFVSEMANYSVALTAHKDFMIASSGVPSSTENKENDNVRTVYTAQSVRDFAFVMSPKFKKASATVGSTTVNYFYFSDAEYEQSVSTAAKALEYFNSTFGKYPYSKLDVAETDFCYGGMEYPCLVMITSGMEKRSYETAIIHEIAHQWWYGLVGNDQVREAYLDEGLAEYSTLMFYRAHPDYQVDAAQMLADTTKQFNTFIKIVGNYNNDTDTSMNRALNEFESQQQYTYMTYLKGMIMFGQVNEVMGDKKFEAALRKYFDTCKLKLATKDDMLACFEKSYGANISNLFNTFINGEDKTIK